MLALILAVGLTQGVAQGSFGVTATVVRPACVDVSPEGAARFHRNRPPGPDSAYCVLESAPSATPPRVVTSTGMVYGREVSVLEINH